MKEQTATVGPEVPVSLKRRNLLCAAAAAGGAMIAGGGATAGRPATAAGMSDPQLRAALLKYGGEFGQLGKGGSHGDL